MLKAFVAVSVAALMLWGTNAQAQPVTTFADVAGKWSGVGSRGGKTDIAVEPDGKFTMESPFGKSAGMAKIEGGILILPFPSNKGQIKLTKTGDVLEGPYVAGALTGTTRVTRVSR